MTPYKLWSCRKPSLDYSKSWGFSPYILIPSHQKGNVDAKTIEGTFVGYPENSIRYRFAIFHNKGRESLERRHKKLK